MKYWIGIDPGKSGAAAAITVKQGLLSWVVKSDQDETDLLASVTRNLLTGGGYERDVHFVVEAVHAMPKNGSISGFKLGQSYGWWRGVLLALWGLDKVTFVSPQKWKKHYGLIGKPKAASRELAQLTFSNTRVINATAEAILLARYGMEAIGEPPCLSKPASSPGISRKQRSVN